MATIEEQLDEEVLKILRQQLESNPDGTPWKMKIGNRFLTKREIIDSWATDDKLRGAIRGLLLELKYHFSDRR